MANLKDLIGKTLTKAQQIGHNEIIFITTENKQYKLHHSQDCCESVSIESITGDLSDLIGSPILLAEEATNNKNPTNVTLEHQDELFLWTFYKFATRKGYVDIRWYGESNGYYSVEVNFDEFKPTSH